MELIKAMGEVDMLEKIMKVVDSKDPVPDEYRHYISLLLHDRYHRLLTAKVDVKDIL